MKIIKRFYEEDLRDLVAEKLGVELPGKVGVKVSTGERGSKGYQ